MAAGRGAWCLAPLAGVLLAGACVTHEDAERRVRYGCDDGSMLTVVFAGDTARLFTNGGSPILLDRQPATSGFRYDAGTHSIRGKGRLMTFVVGRRVPIQCREVGSPR
jgi:membrane-bound inhibitor of C-type lysozyme